MKYHYRSSLSMREHAKRKRDRNREANRCVNENRQLTHGAAVVGVRCVKCDETWKRSR